MARSVSPGSVGAGPGGRASGRAGAELVCITGTEVLNCVTHERSVTQNRKKRKSSDFPQVACDRAGAELEAQGRWHPGRGQAGGLGSAAAGPAPSAGPSGLTWGRAGAELAAQGRWHPGRGQAGGLWQRSCWTSTKCWPKWAGLGPCRYRAGGPGMAKPVGLGSAAGGPAPGAGPGGQAWGRSGAELEA